MSETKVEHTTGRLVHVTEDGTLGTIDDEHGQPVAQTMQRAGDPMHRERQANARRIVACWNACICISDPESLRTQRDELAKALQELLDGIERTPCRCDEAYTGRGLKDPNCTRCDLDLTSEDLDAARAALATATSPR